MSHLTILPTVLRDEALLATSLELLGYQPRWGGELAGFGGELQAVVLQVVVGPGARLGWLRQPDGSLGLVGDLQRLSRSQSAQTLLGTITRTYAAQLALRQVADGFGQAHITLAV